MRRLNYTTIIVLFGILSVFSPSLHAQVTTPSNEIAAGVAACAQKDWITCGLKLGRSLYDEITKLFGWRDGQQSVPAFGGTCIGGYRGGFNNWQWKYSGTFSCDHVSRTIAGQSSKFKSRDGAIRRSMEDFVEKAGRAGVLTPQHIASYKSGHLITTTTSTTQRPSFSVVVPVTSSIKPSRNSSTNLRMMPSVLLLTWFLKL